MKKTLLLFTAAIGCASSLLAQATPQGFSSCPNGYDVTNYFTYTGATEAYTVPLGVTSVFITANAPSGGDGVSNGVSTPTGGWGGFIQGYLNVTPGEVLYVTVGQRGQDAVATGNANAINAFNGGGSGGYSAAGGSGATDIRRGGNTLANRILVAGGGGGAGSNGCANGTGNNPLGGNGGNGGASGTAGGNGVYGTETITGGEGGQIGATATAGIGCSGYPGGIGELNGNGGEGPSFNACLPGGRLSNGGGGGGGYVQGGGGGAGAVGTVGCSTNISSAGGGGAGGANYASSDFTNVNTSLLNVYQGSVFICHPTVNMPTINSVSIVSNDTMPCVGTTQTFVVSGSLGDAADWAWYYDGTFQSFGDSITFTVPNATSGLLQVRAEGGVFGTALPFNDIPLTYAQLPNITITPNSGTFCAEVNIEATGGDTYIWSNGETTSMITLTPANSGQTPTVSATNASGCTASSSATFQIVPNPTATISPSTGAFCGEVTIEAAGGTTYTWDGGATTAAITITNNQPQTVTVSDANGCTASASVALNVYPSFSVAVTFGANTGVLLASPTGGTAPFQYQWLFNGVIISNATSDTYTPTENGDWGVEVSDASGICTVIGSFQVTGVGVNTLSTASFTMSPNPTTGLLVLDNLTIGKNFRLINTLGQLVKSFEVTSTQMTIDISAQPAGTYFLQSEGQAVAVVKQ